MILCIYSLKSPKEGFFTCYWSVFVFTWNVICFVFHLYFFNFTLIPSLLVCYFHYRSSIFLILFLTVLLPLFSRKVLCLSDLILLLLLLFSYVFRYRVFVFISLFSINPILLSVSDVFYR